MQATAIPAPIASDGKWILLVDLTTFVVCMSDKVSFDSVLLILF
jgi:hypothetical protein